MLTPAPGRAPPQDELFGAPLGEDETHELDESVLYRSGESSGPTPRALFFELKGGRGAVNSAGGARTGREREEAEAAAAFTWGGETESYETEPVPRNAFQRYLDSEAKRFDGGDPEEDEAKRRALEAGADVSDDAGAWGGAGGSEESKGAEDGGVARGDAGGAADDSFNFGLDSVVTTWSDFLKAQLHQRSVMELQHFSSTSSFDVHAFGSVAMRDAGESERLYDGFRYFLEECDRFAGVQAFVDVDSGFGGLASSFLDLVADECPHAPIFGVGALAPSVTRLYKDETVDPTEGGVGVSADTSAAKRANNRAANTALSWAGLVDRCSAFVPISMESYALRVEQLLRLATSAAEEDGRAAPTRAETLAAMCWAPNLHVDPTNDYHTSAVLAGALETATLPFRRSGDYREPSVGAGADARLRVEGAETAAMAMDSRMRGGAGAGAGLHRDGRGGRAAEEGAAAELGLPRSISLHDYCTLLCPRESLKVASLAAATPFAHPFATPSQLEAMMTGAPPVHEWRVPRLAQLSFPCELPEYLAPARLPPLGTDLDAWAAMKRQAGHAMRTGAAPGSAVGSLSAPVPFAHSLVVRGVAGGAGASQVALGRVLDGVLRRTSCGIARHAVVRCRQPVPLSWPNYFAPVFGPSGGALNAEAKAAVAGAPLGSEHWGLGDEPEADEEGEEGEDGRPAAAAPYRGIPLSRPVLSYMSNGPSFHPAISDVVGRFKSRNKPLMATFEECGVGAEECREATEVLETLADTYNPQKYDDDA